MRLSDKWQDYCLIDTSDGERLERWGDVTLIRPDPQIIWKCSGEAPEWRTAHAKYNRSSSGGGSWDYRRKLPESWQIKYGELTFMVKPTGFKHTGLFPEQAVNWDYCMNAIRGADRPDKRAEPVRLHRRSYARMRCGGSLRVPCGRSKGHG